MKWILFKVISFLVLIIFLTDCLVIAQPYTWKQRANFGGITRWGAYGFSVGAYGYIGGGYLNGVTLNDVWEYSPSANVWTQKASLPIALRAGGSFTINGQGFITGGVKNNGTINSNLYAYNPATNVWATKSPFPGVAVYGGAGFTVNGKGYYGIGNGGSATGPYYTNFYEYDPVNDIWLQRATFPATLRYGTIGIGLNGKGYVGFGVNENMQTVFNDWWEFDPVNNVWTAKANYPGDARNYPAGIALNNIIFLGTGNSYTGAYNDFYSYEPNTNTWTPEANYPPGNRWLVATFTIGNIGYFGTGAGWLGTPAYNEFYEFSNVNTGINQSSDLENAISVYPNPCSKYLYIKNPKRMLLDVKLLDAKGRAVAQVKSSDEVVEILGKTEFGNGVYFVQISTIEKVFFKKIVINS